MKRLLRLAIPLTLAMFAVGGSYGADLDFAIKLKTGTLHPSLSKMTPAQAASLVDKHALVQFDHPITQNEKDRLASQGLTLIDYVPEMAYTAKVASSFDPTKVNGLRWLGGIDPNYKISPIITNGIPPSARRGGNNVQFTVITHRDENVDNWAAYFQREFGAQILGIERSIDGIEAIMPEQALNRLSELDAVVWIEPAAPPPEEYNNSARVNIGAEAAQAAPYNLSGMGVTVAEWDGGRADPTHPDLAGRVTSLDGSAVAQHSTHVAGTVLGTGLQSGGTYRGMAPGANLTTQQWWNSGSEAVSDYTNAIMYYDASISTNSWGYGVGDPATQQACEATMGNYWSESATLDNLVRGSGGRPITILFAAGNQRGTASKYCGSLGWTYNTMDPLATAKNVIAVGAINSNNSSMTSFSSWGPTDDGRLKPDVVGPGCQSNDDYGVTSCNPGGGYVTMCGTSMATPATAGVVALMREQYNTSFPGNRPLPSTIKGILINTAQDLGQTGPDYQFGHGKVDAVKACAKIAIGEPSYLENQMATGDTHLYDLTVPGNTTKLKVTLVWDDPGGTGLAGKNLINDLDLSLIPPSGPDQLPWVLDPTIPSLDATKGVNRTDNVETVEINNPQAGLWKAKVNGYNIPNGPQKYSLVFTPDSIYTPGNVQALAVYPGGDKTTNPGTSAPVRFWATNIGLNPDSVRVQISDTKSWLNRTIDTVVYLTSYDSAYFDLAAQVPSGLGAGENDVSTCTATSRSNGSVSAHSTVTVTVAAVYVVDLVAPTNDTVGSPASKAVNLTVWNHGNATNTITITPSDQRSWPFRPPNRQFVLNAGTSTVASFTADVPAEEPNQATNLITLTATSTGGAGNVASYTLTVVNPYFPPTLLSPDTMVYLNTRTPHFVWSHGSGTSYGLYIATDSLLTQTVHVYHGLTDTAFTIPAADSLPDRGYYWGVRLFSGSDSSSFQRYPRRLIVDNLAPNVVTPSSPVAKYDSTMHVTYVLGGSAKPLVDSVSPEFNVIQVSADSTFAVGVTTYQPIAAMTFQAPDTLGQGRFYWRARRADLAGNSSAYSARASFVHDTKAPAIPTVLAPATGRNLKGSSIVFKWTEGTPPPYEQSATFFFLHISNLANFGDYNTFANFVYADSQVVNTSLLTPGTHYYWRLKAIDSVGFYSDYGPTYEFTYANYVCGDVDQNGTGPDISDLSYLVDYLFFNGAPPAVLEASSFDCNLVLDISDLTILVDFLFASGAPLCCPSK